MIRVLSIAGSDSCGGAGIQADIKTIHRLGAHALTAVTALTAQNSLGVEAVHPVPERFIAEQVRAVVKDSPPHAVKIGMLGSAAAIRVVAGLIQEHGLKNVVLDPVFRASTGARLLDDEALSSLAGELLPIVGVITPNLEEAATLLGRPVETLAQAEDAARELRKSGPDVVVTGGHLPGECVDVLASGTGLHHFTGERLSSANTHGTGCVFSSALAVQLAFGREIPEAVRTAGAFTREAIRSGYACGKGAGVVNPLGVSVHP